MKNIKLAILVYCTAMFTLVCSIGYAQDNDGTVFLSGRVGSNDRIVGCSGSCSADSSGRLELGVSSDYDNSGFASLSFRLSPTLSYSRHQFNVNGSVISVIEKGIYIQAETTFEALPKCVFVAKIEPTWQTASSLNLPDHTVFGVGSGLDFLYQVEPGFYAIAGLSGRTISSGNQPDFSYRTVDIGFRWYP